MDPFFAHFVNYDLPIDKQLVGLYTLYSTSSNKYDFFYWISLLDFQKGLTNLCITEKKVNFKNDIYDYYFCDKILNGKAKSLSHEFTIP